MPTSQRELLRHTFDECDYVAAQVKPLTHKAFLQDETSKRAIVRSIEIIGEASKALPEDVRR